MQGDFFITIIASRGKRASEGAQEAQQGAQMDAEQGKPVTASDRRRTGAEQRQKQGKTTENGRGNTDGSSKNKKISKKVHFIGEK